MEFILNGVKKVSYTNKKGELKEGFELYLGRPAYNDTLIGNSPYIPKFDSERDSFPKTGWWLSSNKAPENLDALVGKQIILYMGEYKGSTFIDKIIGELKPIAKEAD